MESRKKARCKPKESAETAMQVQDGIYQERYRVEKTTKTKSKTIKVKSRLFIKMIFLCYLLFNSSFLGLQDQAVKNLDYATKKEHRAEKGADLFDMW